mmetsp:Transcript_16995/g.20888  ORF Transcript_16995/g.20888 Transcript_16995/m.20888 type:complete len:340 (+) Transcript_16995:59-1078(+)
MDVSLLPAESLLVAPEQRLRSGTQGALRLSSSVCEGEKTRCCTQDASLVGTSKWLKLTLDEGSVKEKSLSGTSKLLPSLGDEGNAKTVKLQSYDSSVTMKEALAVLKEAALDDVPTEVLKADVDINSGEAIEEPLPPTSETVSPDVSLIMTDAGRSVHPEEVAELRALLEEAIQDDGADSQEKSPKTLWLEEALGNAAEPRSVGIVGKCNPSKDEGVEAPIKCGIEKAAAAPSEDLYDSLSAGLNEKSHTWISNISWAVSSAAMDSLAYSHSESGYSRSVEQYEVPDPTRKLGTPKPATSLDDQKIKAFASAVQGAKGLGEDLQKDLLELLHALPGYKA